MALVASRRFHLVVDGDLLAVARVLRLLRRHRAIVEHPVRVGEGGAPERMEGRVPNGRHARALAGSLSRDPAVRRAFVEGIRDAPDVAAGGRARPGAECA